MHALIDSIPDLSREQGQAARRSGAAAEGDGYTPAVNTRASVLLRHPALFWLGLALAAIAAPRATWAAGQASFVSFSRVEGAFRLASGESTAPILVDPQDDAGVRRAAGDLRDDVQRVTGRAPELLEGQAAPRRADVVIVGTLGRSRLVDGLAARGVIDAAILRGKWEASLVQVVCRPFPGVERALVIAGSDRRGTIFGLYDVSEQIGVSPWYWWADVPVPKHAELFVRPGRHLRGEPAVRYRGIFINDEAPALSGWVREKFGGFNHRFYVKVFELILRLRANFLWPAMWGNAFADDDPDNARLADEYGVVIGTSHHEPMMRAHDEWRRYGEGPWNYARNAERLREFWREGLRRTASYEKLLTLAMRGDGDEPMSEQANVDLLQRIVADQRQLIGEELQRDPATVPQVWALYKEVQEYYERGMRVPDDVTLLWCDDNWGNIRRLPTPEERQRKGGAGIYYHFDYVGGPRSYKWIGTVPLPKIREQMHLAWRYGADRLWVVNVGDIKPMEVPIEFFLDYAWDPGRWPAERVDDWLRAWASREFGAEAAGEAAEIVARYTTWNGRRKPEMLAPETFSLVHYREAERVVEDWRALAARAQSLYERLPAEARDAFYQLVLYPVKASAVVNELYVTVGHNRLYALQGRTSTNEMAEKARALFREDERLSREYNETLAAGKWRHMMDQTRIGYTYWNQPLRNAMPGVQEVQAPEAAELGLAIEGSEASWPGSPRPPVLPALDVYRQLSRFVDVFNRGRQPLEFTAAPSEPWLKVEPRSGSIERDARVWVSADWNAVPIGTTEGSVTLTGPGGASVTVKVPIVNPASPRPETLGGFVETDGHVSIEAEHFTRAIAPTGRSWQVLPAFGRTLSGVTPLPVDAKPLEPTPDGMRLEYGMHLFHEGAVTVRATFAPTQKFRPGAGLRYAIAFDDEAPQSVDLHADASLQAWERSVADGVTVLTSKHTLARAGAHTLKLWVVDPGLVLQKIVVDTGGMKPSYLGPPESFRGSLPNDPARNTGAIVSSRAGLLDDRALARQRLVSPRILSSAATVGVPVPGCPPPTAHAVAARGHQPLAGRRRRG